MKDKNNAVKAVKDKPRPIKKTNKIVKPLGTTFTNYETCLHKKLKIEYS
jgi:hypothetical protein